MRPYFQARHVSVVTNHPLKSVLCKPDHSGRLLKWAVEISEFDISFIPGTAMKAQSLADFLTDLPEGANKDLDQADLIWNLFVDGASGSQGFSVGIVLKSHSGLVLSHAAKIYFSVTNNQAEYEALIACMCYALGVRVRHMRAFSDSELLVNQVMGIFEIRDETLQKYAYKVKVEICHFEYFKIEHIPKAQNQFADMLSKAVNLDGSDYTELLSPTIKEPEVMEIAGNGISGWRKPLVEYLSSCTIDSSVTDPRRLRIKAAMYVLIEGQLFRRSVSSDLSRCVAEEEMDRVLTDVHSGECGSHSGGKCCLIES